MVARRNLIMMLLGLEILLNASSIAFVGASLRWHHMDGQAMALFIMAVAAAEVSVGLALIMALFRGTGSVDPEALETPVESFSDTDDRGAS
jgi:NADH-quinone oxidoreductase subunit K